MGHAAQRGFVFRSGVGVAAAPGARQCAAARPCHIVDAVRTILVCRST
jgi:hypothetical protein